MARGTCTFRQSDVTKALKAAKAAGVEVARVELEKDGKIIIVAGTPSDRPLSNETESDLGL